MAKKHFDQPGILVVDDSPITLQSLTMVLTNFGYRVLTAESGHAAMEVLKTNLPDLIILDIDMPQPDGYKICSWIKENSATRDIPVIFLSGLEETFDIVKGFNAGANDYMVKPIATDELLIRVKTILSFTAKYKEIQERNKVLAAENERLLQNEARINARVAELEQKLHLKGSKQQRSGKEIHS